MSRIVQTHNNTSSMIIFIVDYLGIAAFKSERYTPVGLYCDSPDIFLFSFQSMQSQTGSIHVFDNNSRVKQGKNQAQSFSVHSLNARCGANPVKPFKTF